jgi:hypothetical protein
MHLLVALATVLLGLAVHQHLRQYRVPVVHRDAEHPVPAVLAALFAGYGIKCPLSILRNQVPADASLDTNIDLIGEVANHYGLAAHEHMAPREALLLERPAMTPNIAITVNEAGDNQFVLIWRIRGGEVYYFDPNIGPVREKVETMYDRLQVHGLTWSDEDLNAFLRSGIMKLASRLRRLGLTAALINEALACAEAEPGWQGIAALDAMTRALEHQHRWHRSHHLHTELSRLQKLHAENRLAEALPRHLWSIVEHKDRLILRGAFFIRITGRRK